MYINVYKCMCNLSTLVAQATNNFIPSQLIAFLIRPCAENKVESNHYPDFVNRGQLCRKIRGRISKVQSLEKKMSDPGEII